MAQEIRNGDVVVDGQKWVLLNQWDDQWHWVKMTQTMERYIATGENRTDAVASLVAHKGENNGKI